MPSEVVVHAAAPSGDTILGKHGRDLGAVVHRAPKRLRPSSE